MSVTCAIHQPNFLPWLGYFYKIQQSDVFVFLDSVALSTGGASAITHRTRVLLGNQPAYLSLPIKKTGARQIKDEEILDGNHIEKHLKSLAQHYARAPFKKQIWPLVESIFHFPSLNLADFNINGIESVCSALGWEPKLVRSSDLIENAPNRPQKSELLIELCKSLGANRYLAGSGGSRQYLDLEAFRREDIEVVFSPFVHPVYPQFGNPFVPGLSVLDALMHVGSFPE